MVAFLSRFTGMSKKALDNVGANIQMMDIPTEPLASPVDVMPPPNKPIDPVHKALLTQIALVSIEENAQLPALLSETTDAKLVRRVHLPRNPRVAGDELFALDGVDMIVILTSDDRHIDPYTLRWIGLLKRFNTPTLVILPFEVKKRQAQARLNELSQQVGLPIVSINPDNLHTARQEFVETTMKLSRATGLALASSMPHFREHIFDHLLSTAVDDMAHVSETSDIKHHQVELVRQVCACYGCNGQDYTQNKATFEALVNAVRHYAHRFVMWLPIKDPARQTHFHKTLSTLFVGYATAIYFGATPPTLRKELLPKVWRLYRASGQAIQQ